MQRHQIVLAGLAIAAWSGFLLGHNYLGKSPLEEVRRALSVVSEPAFDADSLQFYDDSGPGSDHRTLRVVEKSSAAAEAGHRSLAANGGVIDPKTVVPRPQFAGFYANPPVTTAKKCEKEVELPAHLFKSQSGEDRMLLKWFHTICEGSYIEMGGLDGVTYSNSYVFNKSGLGWKGVLVELVTHNYQKLVVNRPNEIATIHAGVCSRPQKLHYFETSKGNNAVNGIYEFASPSFREQWWPDFSFEDPRVHEIECDTLDSLLKKNAPKQKFFDFFSLDVEGAEMSVLESIDFDRMAFGVILIEADEHNEMKNLAMRQFLELRGYTFLYEYERSYWFTHLNFYEIYKNLVYEGSA